MRSTWEGGTKLVRPKPHMNSNSPNNDPLGKLLKSWRVDLPLPPAFETNVWSRIERSRRAAQRRVWDHLANWVSNALPRPALAASYMAGLMLVGVSVGWGHAQQEKARLQDELGDRYVQVLDPYLTLASER